MYKSVTTVSNSNIKPINKLLLYDELESLVVGYRICIVADIHITMSIFFALEIYQTRKFDNLTNNYSVIEFKTPLNQQHSKLFL